MSCSVNLTLREIGEPRKYHWSRLCGFTVAQLQAHLEKLFTEGMSWDVFMDPNAPRRIQIDHCVPQSWHKYKSSSDPEFRECWKITNLAPAWEFDNKSKGARFATAPAPQIHVDRIATSVTE
jgi:hypothetical protein